MLDANLFISFLLKPLSDSASNRIVRAGLAGRFDLLLPERLMDEFVSRAENKPYLANRILPQALQELRTILKLIGEPIPRITESIPALTRDPKDDYLIAYALVGRADLLVTGDAHLLDLPEIAGLRIQTARDALLQLGL